MKKSEGGRKDVKTQQNITASQESQRATQLKCSDKKNTFALSPGHIEISLLPELVTLAEVAAEVVLVLHHILGRNKFSDNTSNDKLRILGSGHLRD